MKKLMSLTLSVAVSALAMAAQASASEVKLDVQTDEKPVQMYTLRVYGAGADVGGDDVVYLDDAVSDAQAKVSFTFDLGLSSGIYPYIIKSETGEWEEIGQIAFTNEEEFENAMKELAEALKSQNPGAEIKTVFDSYSTVFNLDDNFSINSEIAVLDTAKAYTRIASKLTAESTIAELKSVYRESMLLCALEKGSDSLIKRVDEEYSAELGAADETIAAAYNGMTATQKLSVAAMEKGAYNDAADYVKAHTKAVALGYLNAADGYIEMGNRIDEMNDIAELAFPHISDSTKGYVLQKLVSKRDFKSQEDFSKKVAEAQREAGGTTGGGTGSGAPVKNTGGSSGGSSAYSIGSGGSVTTPVIPQGFADLGNAEWAREAIEYLTDIGAVSGRSATEFAPGDSITREEFAKILISAFGISADGDVSFADVADTAWYKPYVAAAVNSGIAVGIGDNMFGTGTNITRQDAAVMIVRALGIKGVNPDESAADFIDNAEIAEYAANAVGTLCNAGVISGNPDGSFAPCNSITRAESARMIYSAINLL